MGANGEREIQERKRRERLAASLRENLKRRKAQQRGQRATGRRQRNLQVPTVPKTVGARGSQPA